MELTRGSTCYERQLGQFDFGCTPTNDHRRHNDDKLGTHWLALLFNMPSPCSLSSRKILFAIGSRVRYGPAAIEFSGHSTLVMVPSRFKLNCWFLQVGSLHALPPHSDRNICEDVTRDEVAYDQCFAPWWWEEDERLVTKRA